MMVLGYAGMHRRIYNPYEYSFLRHLLNLNRYIGVMVGIAFVSQFIFFWNFFRSVFKGEKAPQNPWEVGTLEWTIPSPPPHHNYDTIPVVFHGPHEFSHPKYKDRDWAYQTEWVEGLSRKPQ